MEDGLALVLDRHAVVDVLVRYAMALDTRDWELLRTCFVPDASAAYEGLPPADGYEEIENTCRRSLGSLTASQHLLGNFQVLVDGHQARATCYVQAQHVRRGLPDGENFIVAGVYHDSLVRTSDGWRISVRRLDVTWTEGNPAVLGRPR